MSWLIENAAILSGLGVAFLSFLTSFIKFINDRSVSERSLRKLKSYSDIYISLPDRAEAKHDIEQLLKIETGRMLQHANRKLNGTNITAVIVVAVTGGILSYFAMLWALSAGYWLWTLIAWTLFAVVAFFTLGLSVVGLASIYEPPKKDKA